MAEPWKNDPVADAPWLQDAPKRTGLGVNIGAALQDATAGLAGLPFDLAQGAINLPVRGFNAVTGRNAPLLENSVMGSDWIKTQMGRLHPNADPRTIEPGNRFEAITRAGVGGTASALLPAGISSALPRAVGPVMKGIQSAVETGKTIPAAITAFLAGGAGNEAEQHVPDPYKPAANMGAQLATGVAGGLAQRGGRGLLDAFLGTNNVTPERAALARRAIDVHELPLTAPDIQQGGTPMRWLQSALDYLPGSGAGARANALQSAVNRDVGRTIGANTDRITAGTVQQARAGASQQYDQALRNVTMPIDNTLLGGLANVHHDVGISGLADHQIRGVRGVIDRAIDTAAKNNGVIPAGAYQELRKRGSVLDNMLSPGNPLRPYALDIKKSLDDAFARNDPARSAEFKAANERWRAVEAIRPEVKRGAEGNVSPLRIQNAANRAYPERDVNPASSGGHLGELGDIAQTFLRRLPESGTAPRSAILNSLGKLSQGAAGPAVGAAAGMGVGGVGIMPALMGMGGVSLAGRAVNSAMNSERLREALLNRILNPQPNAALIPPWMMTSMPTTGLMGATNAQK